MIEPRQRKKFAIYSQDYDLVLDENGPGDVKQRARGSVRRIGQLFLTRAEARKFLKKRVLPDARAEGYQTEYWVGPWPRKSGEVQG